MWDLVPWPGIKPRPPALWVWCLSHWTTRVVLTNTASASHTFLTPDSCCERVWVLAPGYLPPSPGSPPLMCTARSGYRSHSCIHHSSWLLENRNQCFVSVTNTFCAACACPIPSLQSSSSQSVEPWPAKAALASPKNLLDTRVLSSTPNLLGQRLGEWGPVICVLTACQEIVMPMKVWEPLP